MLTMFWLVFVPIKYFSQREFLCNSFCWFNFQFRSDGDRVYFHSARNNFIKYHWIVFTKHHFVTNQTFFRKFFFIVFLFCLLVCCCFFWGEFYCFIFFIAFQRNFLLRLVFQDQEVLLQNHFRC